MTHPMTSHATGQERIAELREELRYATERLDDARMLKDDIERELEELDERSGTIA